MKKISNDEDESKEIMSSERQIRTLNPEMSWFDQDYIPWPLWLVHSTSFTPWFVQFYIPCHVATRDLPLRSSAATLHVVGPIAGLAAVVRVRFLGRPSRPQRPSGTSSWSESPARWPRVARVVAAQPVRPRTVETVRPLRPKGLAGSRARLSAARIGGGVVGLEFVSPLIPIRLRVVLALPARRPSLGRFVAARPAGPRP